MGFIPNNNILRVGEKVKLTKDIKVIAGTMEKGTIVKVISVDWTRGYAFQDEEGNKVFECGWDKHERVVDTIAENDNKR